jgi:hypothetical protein
VLCARVAATSDAMPPHWHDSLLCTVVCLLLLLLLCLFYLLLFSRDVDEHDDDDDDDDDDEPVDVDEAARSSANWLLSEYEP